MNEIKSFLGVTVAVAMIFVVMAAFMGMEFWMKTLVKTTDVRISPWITGGNVVDSIQNHEYTTLVYEQVFDGLLWKEAKGFVQIGWSPLDKLPEQITDTIDFDNDKKADFFVQLNSKTLVASVTSNTSRFISTDQPIRLKNKIIMRFNLKYAD
jgi:hypothetical protein